MSFVKNPRSGTVMCWQFWPTLIVSPEPMPGVGIFKASHGDNCMQVSLATMPHLLSTLVVILNMLLLTVNMQCSKVLCKRRLILLFLLLIIATTNTYYLDKLFDLTSKTGTYLTFRQVCPNLNFLADGFEVMLKNTEVLYYDTTT